MSNNYLEGKFKYFTQKELERGWDIPEELYPNIVPTAMVLDIIRERIKEPIYINSTYRSPEYNASVGGAKNSQHLIFNAIDFHCQNTPISSIYAILRDFDAKGYIYPGFGFRKLVMGLGLYKTFIHIDTRGLIPGKSYARWRG